MEGHIDHNDPWATMMWDLCLERVLRVRARIKALESWFTRIGASTRLADLGIPDRDSDAVADDQLITAGHREITSCDKQKILQIPVLCKERPGVRGCYSAKKSMKGAREVGCRFLPLPYNTVVSVESRCHRESRRRET